MINRPAHFLDVWEFPQREPTQNNGTNDVLPMLLKIFLIAPYVLMFLALCLAFKRMNELAENHPIANNHHAPEPDPPLILQEHLNDTLLFSAGLTEQQIKDHRFLGYFFDFTTFGMADEPVILNTGEIVDASSAARLVQNRSRLPRGTVVEFFHSPALKNLLTALIQEEVEKKTAKRSCTDRNQ